MDTSNATDIDRFRTDLLAWAEDNLRSFPWREPDASPYEILLAEIFLKQTRSSTVARILPQVLDQYPDPGSLAEADREDLIDLIHPLGLYNHRSKALMEIGAAVAGTGIPHTEEELMELPQVGQYVANATMCFGFGQSRPIVDSNVKRVYTRLFDDLDTESASDEQMWDLTATVLPEESAERYNLALLDFGAAVCTDTSPRCEECFANSYCDFYAQQEELG